MHRLEVATGEWEVKEAYLAGRIEATTNGRFALMSLDQWVTITHNEWGTGSAVTELATNSWTVYDGDIQYDAQTGRLIHANSGLSSAEIQAFKLEESSIVTQEGSGTYGSADGYGGTAVLATDGSLFYYGLLSVDAIDVSSNRVVFSEPIYAATGEVAFGSDGRYFDPHTGDELGSIGFSTTVFGLNRNGCDFWAYDPGTNLLRHFEPSADFVDCKRAETPQPGTGGSTDAGTTTGPGTATDPGTAIDGGTTLDMPLNTGGGNGVQTGSAIEPEPDVDAAPHLPQPEQDSGPDGSAIGEATETATAKPAASSEHVAADAGDAGDSHIVRSHGARQRDAGVKAGRGPDSDASAETNEVPPCGVVSERGCSVGVVRNSSSVRSVLSWWLLGLGLARSRRRLRGVQTTPGSTPKRRS